MNFEKKLLHRVAVAFVFVVAVAVGVCIHEKLFSVPLYFI